MRVQISGFRDWLVWVFVDRMSPSRRAYRLGKNMAKMFRQIIEQVNAEIMGFIEGMLSEEE